MSLRVLFFEEVADALKKVHDQAEKKAPALT